MYGQKWKHGTPAKLDESILQNGTIVETKPSFQNIIIETLKTFEPVFKWEGNEVFLNLLFEINYIAPIK